MQSAQTTQQLWLIALWQDIAGNSQEQFTVHLASSLTKGYNNLPAFLQQFCFLYYHEQLSLQQVAETLNISQHLAKQRWVISISLFRILLAIKPKNPV